jgi:hypothetical protein
MEVSKNPSVAVVCSCHSSPSPDFLSSRLDGYYNQNNTDLIATGKVFQTTILAASNEGFINVKLISKFNKARLIFRSKIQAFRSKHLIFRSNHVMNPAPCHFFFVIQRLIYRCRLSVILIFYFSLPFEMWSQPMHLEPSLTST